MDELSAYRSRIGLFAYTAYKKSSQGRKPKPRPRSVTKQTSKRRATTEVTVEPERRHCTLALVLLLVSVACSIERYGYVSEISYLTSVDWLTGNDTLSLGHDCSYPGNCYYRSTISGEQDLESVPILAITGVISLHSFISDCEQNVLNSGVINKEVTNYSYTELNYRDITSPVSEEPVCTVNSRDNYTVLNYRNKTSPVSEEPVCTVNSCDNYTVLNYRDIKSPVSKELVCTVNSCGNYTVLNYRNITTQVSGKPICTVNSWDKYTVSNYRDITSPVGEESVCTVNSCDNYTVLNYRNITSQVSGKPVCTINSWDNYTVLNYRDVTSPVSEEPVRTVNSCDNYAVLNYRNLTSPVKEQSPCTIRTCGKGSCLYLLDDNSCKSCHSNPNIYANRWMTHPPSAVSYDSITDNYENRWMTLQQLGASYMHKSFSDSVLVSENRHQRTCSFLIGNSGSHAYNGNPPMNGGEEQDIKLIHCEMLNKLMGMVSPDIVDAWDKMKNMAKVYLTNTEIIRANNIIKICDALEEKGKIQYGQYEALMKIFSGSGLVNCCEIVDEYSQKIKDIRSKSSSSLSRKRTRETSPPGTESRKSETVYSWSAVAPTQHKMPPVDMELYVKNWKKEDKLCYVTKGIKHVAQKISSDEVYFHCVVGVSASWKSTAIRHAALHLKENLGFNIYVITSPKEFFTYLDKGIKQIFLQEDVIGECFVDKGMLRLWDKYNDRIKSCLDKNTKFLSSLRVQLYLDQELKGKSYIFNSKHHVTNLSDKLFKLNVSDMKNMLRHYLKFYKVSNIEALIEEIWPLWQLKSATEQHFDKYFPLMCRVFSENESVRVNPREYFSDPLPVLQNAFQRIKNDNKPQFCGLLLCGITELKDEYFSSLCELNKPPHFNSIIESLDLDPRKDLLKIKEALQTLDGVYISHIGNRYIFLHSIFQNIVTYLYDDKYYVFKYATRDFITSRVRLFAKLATDDEYVLVYGEDSVDLLVRRMIHELKSSDDTELAAWFIVSNRNINNEILINRLVTQLYDHHDISITQHMTDWLFYVSMIAVCTYTLSRPHKDVTSRPAYQLLASLITRHDCNRELVGVWGWRYPILLSVVYGLLPVTKLLLTKPEVSLDVSDDDNCCVLHLAVMCGHNNVDMTKYLLSLPDLKCLNHRDNRGDTPYRYAVNKPYVEHRQELVELYKGNGAIL